VNKKVAEVAGFVIKKHLPIQLLHKQNALYVIKKRRTTTRIKKIINKNNKNKKTKYKNINKQHCNEPATSYLIIYNRYTWRYNRRNCSVFLHFVWIKRKLLFIIFVFISKDYILSYFFHHRMFNYMHALRKSSNFHL